MRRLTLTIALIAAIPVQSFALQTPSSVPTSYPEDGAFCGFLTLCADVDKVKERN